MKSLIILLLAINLPCFAQEQGNIKKLEVYGRIIYQGVSSLPLVKRSEIKKKSKIYVCITDDIRIEKSKIEEHINNLQQAKVQREFPDFYALVIVHYYNRKKERYYIATSNAGIYKDNIRYYHSCPFVAAVYSFLPIYYYDYDDNNDFYYQKPCDPIDHYDPSEEEEKALKYKK